MNISPTLTFARFYVLDLEQGARRVGGRYFETDNGYPFGIVHSIKSNVYTVYDLYNGLAVVDGCPSLSDALDRFAAAYPKHDARVKSGALAKFADEFFELVGTDPVLCID